MSQLREHDIRSPELARESTRLMQEDIRRLLQRRDEFIPVGCPACDGPDAVVQFQKGGFDFQECCACGTLYVSPRPSAGLLADYYVNSASQAFWNRHLYPASAAARKERIFKPRVDLLARILGGQQGMLVDVGAGFGLFAALCVEMGIARRVIAVETNREYADSCRKFSGVEVIEAPIEEKADSLHADAITCFELIEHLFAPREFLAACHRGLTPGGVFVCTTPNWHGFDLAVLRERSDNILAPYHLNYFTSTSLAQLLACVGFVEISITTPGELDVDILRNKLMEGRLQPAELPFWGRVLTEASVGVRQDLQQFLQRHGLSSNMLAVARKPKG